MPRRPLAALIAACALAAPLGACGGTDASPATSDAVQRTVERYVSAFAAGDARTACSLLSDDAKAALGPAASCPAGLTTMRELLPAQQRAKLSDARVESVEVEGDRANVRLSSFHDGAATLHRVGGRWLIDAEG